MRLVMLMPMLSGQDGEDDEDYNDDDDKEEEEEEEQCSVRSAGVGKASAGANKGRRSNAR